MSVSYSKKKDNNGLVTIFKHAGKNSVGRSAATWKSGVVGGSWSHLAKVKGL